MRPTEESAKVAFSVGGGCFQFVVLLVVQTDANFQQLCFHPHEHGAVFLVGRVKSCFRTLGFPGFIKAVRETDKRRESAFQCIASSRQRSDSARSSQSPLQRFDRAK